MGSRTLPLKIDGFGRTRRTHADEAPVLLTPGGQNEPYRLVSSKTFYLFKPTSQKNSETSNISFERPSMYEALRV